MSFKLQETVKTECESWELLPAALPRVPGLRNLSRPSSTYCTTHTHTQTPSLTLTLSHPPTHTHAPLTPQHSQSNHYQLSHTHTHTLLHTHNSTLLTKHTHTHTTLHSQLTRTHSHATPPTHTHTPQTHTQDNNPHTHTHSHYHTHSLHHYHTHTLSHTCNKHFSLSFSCAPLRYSSEFVNRRKGKPVSSWHISKSSDIFLHKSSFVLLIHDRLVSRSERKVFIMFEIWILLLQKHMD